MKNQREFTTKNSTNFIVIGEKKRNFGKNNMLFASRKKISAS